MAEKTAFKTLMEQRRLDLADRLPITGSQVVRLGIIRPLIGGGSMYYSVPMFCYFQYIVHMFVINIMVAPLLGLPDLPLKNYIIIDRDKIEGLHWFDKLNCKFCGWANGISMLNHARLEQLGNFDGQVSIGKKLIIGLITLVFAPITLVIEELAMQIIYNVLVSRPLGMKRLSIRDSYKQLNDSGYASRRGALARAVLRYQKSYDIRLENSLEQIESSWCPFKHFDKREEAVYPDHHKNFFGSDQIEEVKEILQTDGTVSDTKPYW